MNRIAVYIYALCMPLALLSCEKHTCDDGHDHEAHPEEEHAETSPAKAEEAEKEGHADEIIFPADRAREAGVVVAEVRPADFREVIKVSGMIDSPSTEEVSVSATGEGLISFPASLAEGMSVKQGALLCTLSTRELAGGDPLNLAKTDYDLSRKELERVEDLYARHLATNRDLQEARQAYETAKLAWQSLSTGHTDGGRGVTAPLSGYIKNIQVRAGEYVTQGQALFTVTRNQRLTLRARLPERYLGVLPGVVSANFRTAADTAVNRLDQLHGRLLATGKSVGADGYIPLTFEFDNQGHFIPGSQAEVYLLGASRKGVITLPREAVTEEEGVFFVYIRVDEEGYVKREVRLGASDGSRMEILSGLHPGEKVVMAGAYQLRLASASASIPSHSHSH